jgi:Na+/melibiose symporter-like transporter
MERSNGILPFNLKLAYAMPAFALAVVGIPVYVYIPKFYTDIVGVDIAVVGYLLFGVRIFDAVTDPIIGWWSDRSNHLVAIVIALFYPLSGEIHRRIIDAIDALKTGKSVVNPLKPSHVICRAETVCTI